MNAQTFGFNKLHSHLWLARREFQQRVCEADLQDACVVAKITVTPLMFNFQKYLLFLLRFQDQGTCWFISNNKARFMN